MVEILLIFLTSSLIIAVLVYFSYGYFQESKAKMAGRAMDLAVQINEILMRLPEQDRKISWGGFGKVDFDRMSIVGLWRIKEKYEEIIQDLETKKLRNTIEGASVALENYYQKVIKLEKRRV